MLPQFYYYFHHQMIYLSIYLLCFELRISQRVYSDNRASLYCRGMHKHNISVTLMKYSIQLKYIYIIISKTKQCTIHIHTRITKWQSNKQKCCTKRYNKQIPYSYTQIEEREQCIFNLHEQPLKMKMNSVSSSPNANEKIVLLMTDKDYSIYSEFFCVFANIFCLFDILLLM